MEKFSKLCFFLFAVAILASLCACNLQDKPLPSVEMTTSTPTPTSEPMVSIPEETKLPTEMPVDRTEPYIIDDKNFEIYNEVVKAYRYVGSDQTVSLADYGLEVHIPEEWVGQVEVIRNARPGYLELFIANSQLMQAYADMDDLEIQQGYGWYDWILLVQAICKEDTVTLADFTNSEYRIYLGENDTYQFYFATSDMHSPGDTSITARDILIRKQGQAYYDNLVGDLVCTVDQAKEILKII